MLYLHNNQNDALGKRINEFLKDLSAAFKQVEIDMEESFIRENDMTIKGETNIVKYLELLKRDLEDERLLSADACLMNPKSGEIC